MVCWFCRRGVRPSGQGAVDHSDDRGGNQVGVPIEDRLVPIDHFADERLSIAVTALGGVDMTTAAASEATLPTASLRPARHGPVRSADGPRRVGLGGSMPPPTNRRGRPPVSGGRKVDEVAEELLGFGPSSEQDEGLDPTFGDPPGTGTAESGGTRKLDGTLGEGRDSAYRTTSVRAPVTVLYTAMVRSGETPGPHRVRLASAMSSRLHVSAAPSAATRVSYAFTTMSGHQRLRRRRSLGGRRRRPRRCGWHRLAERGVGECFGAGACWW